MAAKYGFPKKSIGEKSMKKEGPTARKAKLSFETLKKYIAVFWEQRRGRSQHIIHSFEHLVNLENAESYKQSTIFAFFGFFISFQLKSKRSL